MILNNELQTDDILFIHDFICVPNNIFLVTRFNDGMTKHKKRMTRFVIQLLHGIFFSGI